MVNSKLFQYAILWHPNSSQQEKGEVSKIIVEPTTILATEEKTVLMLASKEIPDKYNEKLDQIEIAVRSF